MGYLTRYSLEWKSLKPTAPVPNCPHDVPKGAKFCPECGIQVGVLGIYDLVSNAIKEAKDENPDNFYAIDPDGGRTEACKWYEHEKDMAEFSRKFPKVLFTLKGEGEESGDIWAKYFVNGKMQVEKARVIFGEFNPALLGEAKPVPHGT